MQPHQQSTINFNGNHAAKHTVEKRRTRAGSAAEQLLPAKRRNEWGSSDMAGFQSDHMPEDRNSSDTNWPLFGDSINARSVTQPDDQRDLIGFLGDRADTWQRPVKLETLVADIGNKDQFDRWRSVGCQLCFVNNVTTSRHHHITKCNSVGSDKAKPILQWLESLKLERFAGGYGHCSLCTQCTTSGEICCEVSAAHYLRGVDTEYKAAWRAEIDSAKGKDGLCENKKVVRETIAALSAYEGQILGRATATLVSQKYGINLAIQEQATQWFEQQIRYKQSWIPQMLLVFDLLVASYDFLQNRWSNELVNSETTDVSEPESDDVNKVDDSAVRWDTEDEVHNWTAIADWWKGKRGRCGFCVGQGLRNEQIEHTMGNCKRGGKLQLAKGLGKAIYKEGFRALGGCPDCAMPREVCQAWSKQGSRWKKVSGAECQYGTQAYDTAIGFYYCKNLDYKIRMAEAMEEKNDKYDATNEDDVASWLGGEISTETGVQSSEIMRQLAEWTSMSQEV